MKFLRKLERNFGKYAVPNLMYYIILMYGAGIVIDLVMPGLYYPLPGRSRYFERPGVETCHIFNLSAVFRHFL